ncbi:MAG: cyclic nucleotide-binding domain-containing protein [Archangiaceae bacterium]|nr:cyclic nucleotide-binding domain-containing protein [Archangiaceae bacterium]
MSGSSLRELGLDLVAEEQWEKALGVFAEAVRRQPADHRSRMLAARCFEKLSEPERAVSALHACAEGLLRRDYLLSAIAACKQALAMSPHEKRLKETLHRIHARAAKSVAGKARVPPPLPPETLFDGKVSQDLMSLQGSALSDAAINVLAAPDTGSTADSEARPPLPLFADLDRDAFVELVVCMAYHEVPAGELISREGQNGDTIFVLVAGKAEVTRQIDGQPKTLAFLSGGSIFGELAMLTGAPLTASVTTVADCDVLEIRRVDLNQIARSHPSVPQTLTAFAQNRMAKNLMATSPLFQQVPETDRQRVLTRFLFKALQPNEKTMVEGQHPDGLYLVLAGELVVQKEDPSGGVVSLGILREGDIAGEISLITGLRASATVQATRKTAIAFLERSAFEELVKEFPQVKAYLQGLSERRLKMIGEALRPAEILDADELVVEAQ